MLFILGGDYAETYRNRKGYFSFNVQTICTADLRIKDIVCRWPGATHDQIIFDNSVIKTKFDSGEMRNMVLLGDSGYSLSNYLITPMRNPQQPHEHLFQESIIRTRNVVERMYGVWKRRFPVLSLGIRLNVERIQAVVVACAVLHNIAILNNEDEPLEEPDFHVEMNLFHYPMQMKGFKIIEQIFYYIFIIYNT